MRYSTILKSISNQFIKKNLPQIRIGDIVKVGIGIQEGKKQRIQPYSGTVIALHNNHLTSTITVRRIFQGIGIERVFLIHSPSLGYIEIIRHSKVRRSKLYYLRTRVGKAARLKTKLMPRSTSKVNSTNVS